MASPFDSDGVTFDGWLESSSAVGLSADAASAPEGYRNRGNPGGKVTQGTDSGQRDEVVWTRGMHENERNRMEPHA
jgi:hypothetical protein